MKTTLLAFTLVALTILLLPAQTVSHKSSSDPAQVLSTAKESDSAFAIIEIGENHRVWQRVVTETNEFGKVVSTTNSFTELQTGLYYQSGPGDKWLETKAEIELLADGAAATNGPHKVFFAANLNAVGAISLTTPEGQLLRSRVFGLSYFDAATGKAVLIAETKDSIGQLIYPNQVIYTNAFDDVSADTQYFYTKAGLEQNIVVRAQLPDPAEFGMSRETAILQVLTEFYDSPVAERKPLGLQATGLRDEVVDFGRMKMARGKAFSVGDETARAKSVPVAKQWVVLSGRTFLVEEVPFKLVDAQLQTLTKPKRTAGLKPRLQGKGENIAAALLSMLPKRTASHTRGVVRLAKLDTQKQPGFVLDYSILNGATNFTFKGDSTYFVTNTVNLFGTTTIEGGTVLKFAANGAGVVANDEMVFKTSHYRLALFTSKDDNSVGETISGSTGNPAFGSSSYLTAWTAHYAYLRFCYAGYGLTHGAAGLGVVEHCQFVNCDQAFGSSADAALRNVLFAHCNLGVAVQNNATNTAEQVTADQCNLFFLDTEFGCSSPLYVTNSIFTAVTNLGCGVQLDHCVQATNALGIFQAVGAGNYYLAAGSTNRGAGTTNINADLLAALQKKTTYPPLVLSNVTASVSTNLTPQAQRGGGTPDLGYYYDPIDYLTCWFTVSNATLTVDSGTAIACYRDTGIWIADGSSIVSRGTPLTPNWFTRHSMVQEQPVAFGVGPAAVINSYHYADLGPSGEFRFSRFSCPAGANDYHLYHVDFSGESRFAFDNLSVRDCEFWNGMNYLSGARTNAGPVTVNNNLFHRSRLWANSTASQQSLALSNNLVVGMNLAFYGATSDLWKLYDNAFDSCTFILASHPITNGNNAYINCANRLNPTNASDVVLTNFTYQAGPLGNYYQPTNSALINAGSVTNAAIAGLFHYTTTTNQVKETDSTVDIGYHYAAVDDSGQSIDTDGDGVPDYADADSDGDSLPDTWELQCFGNLSQPATGDPDADRLTNVEEYLLGYDPTIAHTGGSNASDADKDYDGDLLSNVAELRRYSSSPTNPHTFNLSKTDAAYVSTASAGDFDSAVDLIGPYFPGGNKIQFFIIGALGNAAYDLYIRPDVNPGTKWKRYYSASAGQTEITCPIPPGSMNYFCIGLASDGDGDGLTDGYECLVSLTGLNTDRSDADDLPDGWEVEYVLDPKKPLTPDSPSNPDPDGNYGNPDYDALVNRDEFTSITDPKRHNESQQPRRVVSVTVTDPTASEAGDTATFRFTRTGDLSTSLTVYYVLGGSATVGADYTLSPSPSESYPGYSITIPGGSDHADLQITPLNDAVVEGTETVIIGLMPNASDQYVVTTSPHRAMVTIRDRVCHTYEVNADFLPGLLVGVEVTNDRLYLQAASHPQFPHVNVACSGRGTVARINVDTGAVVGEYRTSPDDIAGSPSRTTVDQYGYVWVANRDDSLNGNGSITRIGLVTGGTAYRKNVDGTYTLDSNGQYLKGPFTFNNCLDRDGDGYIRTSRGLADILRWTNQRDGATAVDSMGGVSTAEDEVIQQYVRVEATGTRTIAVDKFNDIWVGGNHLADGTHQKVNGLTAQVIPDTIFSPYCGGYGGLIDSQGILWSARSGGSTLRFVPPTSFPPPDWSSTYDCLWPGDPDVDGSLYGIAVDPNPSAKHIWQTAGQYLIKWNPDGTIFKIANNVAKYPHGYSFGQGLTIDANGQVWVAHRYEPTVGHVKTDGTYIGNVAVGTYPTGLSVDSNGKIWVANEYSDNAMRIDPNAGPFGSDGVTRVGAVDLTVDLGDGSTHQPPYNVRAAPYNYSDMTGFNNQIVNPGGCPLKGYWVVVEDGGWANTLWESVSWDAPAVSGTGVEVYVRAADDRPALSNKQFTRADNGVPLAGIRGRYLEVRTSLTRGACEQAPYLERLTVCRQSPTLSVYPLADQSVEEGQDVQFTAVAIGTEPLSYQWFFNNVAISGANDAVLSLSVVDCFDSGYYSVRVTDASGEQLEAGPANLDVYPRVIIIPSTGIASAYPAQITVVGAPSAVSYVEVVLYGFKHDRPDDVDILLVSPTGKKIMLMSDAGGDTPVQNVTFNFLYYQWPLSDEGPLSSNSIYYVAASSYGEQEMALPPATGGNPNPPTGPYSDILSDLNGTNPNGVWKLYVVDDTNQKSGWISGSWCLILHP